MVDWLYFEFHPIRLGLLGFKFCMLQQKEKNFLQLSTYDLLSCGCLLGKMLDGI